MSVLVEYFIRVHVRAVLCMASGTSQNVHAVLQSKTLPLLLKGDIMQSYCTCTVLYVQRVESSLYDVFMAVHACVHPSLPCHSSS